VREKLIELETNLSLMVSKKWLALAIIPVIVVVDVLMLLPFITQPSMQEMVPTNLAAFFNTFDQNHDNKISIAEAETFYNWCKAHIPYRYDDENQANPVYGITVGDGRPGVDYWQKPIETYDERMGDCEDMTIFSVAFYRHYNVSAYMVTVNAGSAEVDHAACAVNIGRITTTFKKLRITWVESCTTRGMMVSTCSWIWRTRTG